MYKSVTYLLVLLVGLQQSTAHCQSTCRATVLSRAEARKLVGSVHDAIVAQRQGGAVEADAWDPGSSYRRDIFEYFVLQVPADTAKTALDNGIIGYFAVNIRSGRVVNTVLGEEEGGDDLKKLQVSLRLKHCISADVVNQNEPLAP
jgi:hypothetical protein